MPVTFQKPGYRMLQRGEKVLPGDEMRGAYNQRWLPADHTVTEQYAMPYRRKLTDEEINAAWLEGTPRGYND